MGIGKGAWGAIDWSAASLIAIGALSRKTRAVKLLFHLRLIPQALIHYFRIPRNVRFNNHGLTRYPQLQN